MSDGGAKQQRDSERFDRACGRALRMLDHWLTHEMEGQMDLRGFTVRAGTETSGDVLVVVRAFDHEGGPVVGFHAARTVSEALTGAVSRIRGEKMKWRGDDYAIGKGT